MRADILTIGDELLIGQVVNTNQAYIAEHLSALGITIGTMVTVGDDAEAILSAFAASWEHRDIVIVTGGLGPTHDDITKKAVCRFFRTDLVSNDDVRAHIASLLRGRSMRWTASAEEQTLVPRSARILPNPKGTAPGLLFEDQEKFFIVLPGVPYEMEAIMHGSVIPLLRSRTKGELVVHRTLRTTGIAESALAERLGNIEDIVQGASLAFLPSPLGVRLRISATATDNAAATAMVVSAENRIRQRAEQYIYGVETEELEEVLGRLLTERKMTIAVAESCTGGLIADRLTNVPGSSVYLERGVVAYSNTAKTAVLGVPEALIRTHGAVSQEVAEAMAEGVRRSAGTDIGIATTGIAGPAGATTEKPLGLVWIGYSDARETIALKFNFGADRLRVKQRASQAALELIRRHLLDIS
jgi:nicotinamide-nucleotide amidase